MPISIENGVRLGPYEILGALGRGATGQVYKARDTRLGRLVALKVLHADFSEDSDHRKRFEREARAVSALNHPRICTLYDVGQDKGHEFLVMEFLEGETLADRLKRGPLPLHVAVQHTISIAEGLDHAHRLGLTHRDLKPANVMLTRAGAKLLDFGLAKLRNPASEATAALDRGLEKLDRDREAIALGGGSHLNETALTQTGVIVGTFGYMSPEQLQGSDADARSDIFALGALLYELVTGRKAFEGTTSAALIGAVLAGQPAPIKTLDPAAPALLDKVIERCLAKDPEERWQTVRDFLVPLRWIADGIGLTPTVYRSVNRPIIVAVLCLSFLLAGLSGGILAELTFSPATQPLLTRWDVAIPSEQSLDAELFPSIGVSPDGAHIVFRAQREGTSQLFIRRLGQFEAQPIDASENGHTPFFKPDGQWLGFLANGRIYKVPVTGGTPSLVCEAPSLSPGSPGATWGIDDTIVFAAGAAGLMQVPASGGKPSHLTTPSAERGEVTHIGPQFLPGGEELLFTVRTAEDEWKIAVLSLATGQWDWLPPVGDIASTVYTGNGHLMYSQSGGLYVLPVDLRRRQFTGPATPLFSDVYTRVVSDAIVAQFSISNNGVLAYVSGHPPEWDLVRVNANGQWNPLARVRRPFRYPRVSPDGTRVAMTVEEERADIYLLEVERTNLRKLTSTGTNTLPVWMQDSQRVVYASRRRGSKGYDIYSSPVRESAEAALLFSRDGSQFPSAWSPRDGKLAFYELSNDTARDIWMWSETGGASGVLATPANERGGTFSPDGAWLAYVSNELGRDEVYVSRYPGPSAGEIVSSGGGTEPVWSPKGGELFYWNKDQLFAVTIRTAPQLSVGAPRQLLQDGAYVRSPPEAGQPNYGVFPDGTSFVMIRTIPSDIAHLHVMQNWFAQLNTNRQ